MPISLKDIKKSLQKLLVGELFGNIENQEAILQENDISATLKEVKITDISDNAMLIKIDYGDVNKHIFRSENGQRKRCDYLIIAEQHNNKKILFFIEIKSKTFNEDEITQKFLASECLFDYMVSMLNRFYKKNFNLDEWKKRFILFQKTRINKKQIHPAKDGTTPENYLSINFDSNNPPTLKSLS
ncbi:MAG: hypothetical protein LBI18_14475 [Planctomycetaceae bacterium]|nr:hypothetical protein [Planctomycetaceae bacterium]